MLRASLFGLALAAATPLSAQGEVLPADDEPYPALAVLEAFKTGCGSIEDQAAASASLTKAGWQVSAPAAHPDSIADFLEFAQSAGSEMVRSQGATMSDMEVFENDVAGERLFIVLSEVRMSGVRISGCRLFDPGETRKLPLAATQEWIGREPIQVIDREGALIADWEPGILPEHDSFQLFFIPADSALKQITRFDGVALKSDTVGASE